MSTTTGSTSSDLDVVLAMCCECGTTRIVKRRAIGGHRDLRCDTCGTTTLHSAMMDDPRLDGREVANAAREVVLSLDDKLDVLEAMGASVRYVDVLTGSKGERLIAAVWWYMQTDSLKVDINRWYSDSEIECTVSKILDVIAEPRKYRWRVLHTLADADGDGEIVVSMGYTR